MKNQSSVQKWYKGFSREIPLFTVSKTRMSFAEFNRRNPISYTRNPLPLENRILSSADGTPIYPLRNFAEQSTPGIPRSVNLQIYYRYDK